jgi:hypothetical protein
VIAEISISPQKYFDDEDMEKSEQVITMNIPVQV